MSSDLHIIKLPTRQEREAAKVDNSAVSGLLRRMADMADESPDQMLGCGVFVSYHDGAAGSAWAGDDHLELLKALNVLRLRLEREVD